MVAGCDQGFSFQGQRLAVGVAQQVPLVQGIQEGFAVVFVQVVCRKALADRGPWFFAP